MLLSFPTFITPTITNNTAVIVKAVDAVAVLVATSAVIHDSESCCYYCYSCNRSCCYKHL